MRAANAFAGRPGACGACGRDAGDLDHMHNNLFMSLSERSGSMAGAALGLFRVAL